MAFDIHQPVLDEESDDLDEEKVQRYEEELRRLFEQSPEAKPFMEADDSGVFWADTLVEFGLTYLGVTPPQMTPGDLNELLYGVFPSKVSALDFDATRAIRQMRAFWDFLKREFSLSNADACLKVLDEKAIGKFDRAMNNPANFGPAKSMVMMGAARGFDMSSEEGINRWMQTYQAEMIAGEGIPIPLPGETGPAAARAHGQIRHALRKDKRKRKMAEKSRKQNRKKKK
jgi:hypothetical protein